MKLIRKILILLCTYLTFPVLNAQENLDLKGTACVPERTTVDAGKQIVSSGKEK